MIVVFASTGGLTGGEILIAGGSAVLGQKLLETVFGEDAVRRLAAEARSDLQAEGACAVRRRTRAVRRGARAHAIRVVARVAAPRVGRHCLRTWRARPTRRCTRDGVARRSPRRAPNPARERWGRPSPRRDSQAADALLGSRRAAPRTLTRLNRRRRFRGDRLRKVEPGQRARRSPRSARTHVRRPTTSEALAVTWEPDGAVRTARLARSA